MRHPVNKVYITQPWGVNPEVYKVLGLKGHNGTDYRIFDKNGNKASVGELIAPHDGKIVEARFDANGYGWYYKIENDKEGSILAHNDELFLIEGSTVKEGDVIARTGNTGWSTAPHVHWGYYPKPRDRSNGYSGTINQIPLLEGKDNMTELETCLADRKKFWDERDSLYRALGVDNQDKALSEISRLKKTELRVIDLENENDTLRKNQGTQISQKAEFEALGKKFVVNGANVDSDGKPVFNYKLME